MRRTQAKAIGRDLEKKMVLLSGPRQVGKSYLARSIAEGFQAPQYLNHDSRTEIPTGRRMCAKRSETWDSGCAMGFSRTNAAKLPLEGDSLTSAMIGIGMNFAGKAETRANIEDTLLFASAQAMEGDDLRILAVLVTWFGVNASWVNADRLTKLIGAQRSTRVRALWSALAHWHGRDRRFERMMRLHRGPPIDLLAVGTAFQIRRHGEDPRFEKSALRVPANVLRNRTADVLTPAELAQWNLAFRYRVMMGPSYRADMWAALEAESQLSAAELARRTYGSFATAWNVRKAFAMLRRA